MEDILNEYFSPDGSTPLFPFDWIDSKITLLRKAMDFLDEHPEALLKKEKLELIKGKAKAGGFLSFYLIQEIQDFYRQAHRRFEGKIDFPETSEPVKEFRNSAVAHINVEKASDIAIECILLQEIYGYENILNDYKNFKNELYSKFNSGELKI